MTVASIAKEIRGFDVYNIVIFVFSASQAGNTIDLSTRGFSNSHGTPQAGDVLLIEEYSAIPGNGSNLISASTATLAGSVLTINSSSTRLLRVTGL